MLIDDLFDNGDLTVSDCRAGAGKLGISSDSATVACTEADGLKQTGGATMQDTMLGARQ